MGRVHYVPNKQLYHHHYMGGSLPVFSGTRLQPGYGIGSFFGMLKRNVLPLLKSTVLPILKNAGKNLVRSGTDIVSDVILDDKDIKKSIIERGKQGAKRVAAESLPILATQLGSGHYRKRVKRKRLGRNYKHTLGEDIFD